MREENVPFVRILSVLLVMAGAWLGYEYLNAPPTFSPVVATHPPIATRGGGVPTGSEQPSSGSLRIPVRQAADDGNTPAQPPASAGAVHKCRVQGQIVYSDVPCSGGTGVKIFTPTLTAAATVEAPRNPAMPSPALQPPRGVQPEQQLAAVDTTASKGAARPWECKWIDERIAAIDAQARQPHDPQEGDRLKDRRKELIDRRFSLGC